MAMSITTHILKCSKLAPFVKASTAGRESLDLGLQVNAPEHIGAAAARILMSGSDQGGGDMSEPALRCRF
jgi:hypothetical protein